MCLLRLITYRTEVYSLSGSPAVYKARIMSNISYRYRIAIESHIVSCVTAA